MTTANTFKFHGAMRYADDSQLWGEILKKERSVSENMRDMILGYEGIQGNRFGNSKA